MMKNNNNKEVENVLIYYIYIYSLFSTTPITTPFFMSTILAKMKPSVKEKMAVIKDAFYEVS